MVITKHLKKESVPNNNQTPEDFIDTYEYEVMASVENYEAIYLNRFLNRVFNLTSINKLIPKRDVYLGLKDVCRILGWSFKEAKEEFSMEQLRFEAVENMLQEVRKQCNATLGLAISVKDEKYFSEFMDTLSKIRREKGTIDIDTSTHELIFTTDENPF